MGVIGYYLALPFIYGIALLPFPLLYAFSDLLYLLLFKVIGYRREVVHTNLRNSFPDKSAAEIDRIRRVPADDARVHRPHERGAAPP